ncbi:MAG: glutathione S-transferase family protein [Chlamydiales bacterium]|nr:glutathione S-transferase family protein [Chlamydiales bacterium]
MITLYLYPGLFGLEDNNPFGLKVVTFLKLTKVPFEMKHIVDTSKAPRGQLPYMEIDGEITSDSNEMIEKITKTYQLLIDNTLSEKEKALDFAIRRMLDEHLYWVMSYSRWQDETYWPRFEQAFIETFPNMQKGDLDGFRENNIKKYQMQGIGRYSPEDVYKKGTQDLKIIETLLSDEDYFFGKTLHTIDACIYGFLANIYYYEIETPLRSFIQKSAKLSNYLKKVHVLVSK